jgi:ATP-binding cassette subfamily G (WHITE) protein 2 (PDR)
VSEILTYETRCIIAGLFIGFSFFQADATQAGLQTVIFSAFMMTTIFSSLVQQVSSRASQVRRLLTIPRFTHSSSHSALSTNLENVLARHTLG